MSRLTRRSFAAMLAGGAALPFGAEQAFAQLSAISSIPSGAVRLNSNENPLGPCQEALEAMYAAVRDGGRYRFEESGKLARTIAEVEGVKPDCVAVFAGSSDPLHRAVMAYTSATRAYVTANPGFELGGFVARSGGAKVASIPLTKTYAHDVRAMAKADPNSGLLYVCNPNNPTGTLTSRADIEWLVANKPAGCIVLVDEAYIHLSSKAATCVNMAAAGKDVLVLRTFSKLYGMAGIRAGAAIARPDILEKLGAYGPAILPVAAMVGAQAALRVKDLVPARRKINADVRDDTLSFLDKQKFAFVPSESNKFMVDVRQPGANFIRAMARENVFVGRVWPAWPTHVRVTVGTREEMEKFKAAFLRVV